MMSVEASGILGAIVIGIGATLVMDLWNLFLKRTFSIPSLNYCLLGRWLRHMPAGTLRHASITAAPQKPHECMVGWIAHYTIGVVFALAFVLASGDWLARPTALPAILYGIATVVFPFFILQPSFGLGMAASKTPNPVHARLKSLVTHTIFGIGLYMCAVGVSYVLTHWSCGMKQVHRVTTRLPNDSDLEADNIKRLSDLINEVYDAAESGMWKRTGTRTNPAEVERLLRARALILAEMDGLLVGSVNVNLMGDGVGEFGMLVADLNRRGEGIGSALVDRAESWARDGGCHTMRLELLTPRTWTHPSKEFLKTWYSRIGYRPQATEPLEIMHPELVPELATECDFTVWHKSLA